MLSIFHSLRNELKILRTLIRQRVYSVDPEVEKSVVDAFHKLYVSSGFFGKGQGNIHWLGVQLWKCPLDLWIYQEIIHESKPDFIIECGTARGGSALFFACLFDLVGGGRNQYRY